LYITELTSEQISQLSIASVESNDCLDGEALVGCYCTSTNQSQYLIQYQPEPYPSVTACTCSFYNADLVTRDIYAGAVCLRAVDSSEKGKADSGTEGVEEEEPDVGIEKLRTEIEILEENQERLRQRMQILKEAE
jgi:hypothetical protein